jgi:hypothetical protein
MAILVASAIMFGSAGTAAATGEECSTPGAQVADQNTEQSRDKTCGETDASADQGEKQDRQTDADRSGPMQIDQAGDQGPTQAGQSTDDQTIQIADEGAAD